MKSGVRICVLILPLPHTNHKFCLGSSAWARLFLLRKCRHQTLCLAHSWALNITVFKFIYINSSRQFLKISAELFSLHIIWQHSFKFPKSKKFTRLIKTFKKQWYSCKKYPMLDGKTEPLKMVHAVFPVVVGFWRKLPFCSDSVIVPFSLRNTEKMAWMGHFLKPKLFLFF